MAKALWAVFLLLATAASGRAEDADPAAALLAIDATFSWTSQQLGRAKAFEMYLDKEAVALFPGLPPLQGRDAIVKQLEAAGGGQLSWRPQKATVATSGDLGFTWGLYELTQTGQDGQPRTIHGKYVTVWRKLGDGPWKIVLDGGSANPPP